MASDRTVLLPTAATPIFGDSLAVLDPIEPGYSVRIPTAPVIAARAVEAEPDDAENLYA